MESKAFELDSSTRYRYRYRCHKEPVNHGHHPAPRHSPHSPHSPHFPRSPPSHVVRVLIPDRLWESCGEFGDFDVLQPLFPPAGAALSWGRRWR